MLNLFYFLSVLGSLWVEDYRNELKEKEELNTSMINLSNEISSKSDYSKEHIYQKKTLYMTNYILENYNTYMLDVTQLFF